MLRDTLPWLGLFAYCAGRIAAAVGGGGLILLLVTVLIGRLAWDWLAPLFHP